MKITNDKVPIIIITTLFSLLIIVTIVFYLVNIKSSADESELGIKAVKYLYHFSSLEELDDNMDKLREIVSEDVYELLTIDNTDRTLQVYLKFNNKPVFVNIKEVTPNYVLYSLETENISKDREFLFAFKVNKHKIVEVNEFEVIRFDNYSYKDNMLANVLYYEQLRDFVW